LVKGSLQAIGPGPGTLQERTTRGLKGSVTLVVGGPPVKGAGGLPMGSRCLA
jgi:hypothetical protein